MRSWVRGVRNVVVLLLGIAQALAAFAWLYLAHGFRLSRAQRVAWLHRWCSIGLRRLRIATECDGPRPGWGLIVANHLSYLDILMLSAALPCAFVSKAEVRSWPLLGTFARLAGTIFIDRSRPAETQAAGQEIAEALQQKIPVILFPEGTSSDGSTLLRFHSSLFEPAVRLRAPVTAAWVSYQLEGGSVGTEVCYWGDMTFVPHLLNLLSKPRIKGQIRFGERARTYDDRKQAAMFTHDEVVALASAPISGPGALASAARVES